MPILRDDKTGQGLAMGTPEEMALLYKELGTDQVHWDDAPGGIDVDAILSYRDDQMDLDRRIIEDLDPDGDNYEELKRAYSERLENRIKMKDAAARKAREVESYIQQIHNMDSPV